MALVPCVRCRQPFYASCHDASCLDALCPYCEYGEGSVDAERETPLTMRKYVHTGAAQPPAAALTTPSAPTNCVHAPGTVVVRSAQYLRNSGT